MGLGNPGSIVDNCKRRNPGAQSGRYIAWMARPRTRTTEPTEDDIRSDPDFSYDLVYGIETRGGRQVAVDLRESRRYRAHLRLMRGRTFKKIVSELERIHDALDILKHSSDEDLDEVDRDPQLSHDLWRHVYEPALMLMVDVRSQPRYWLDLKSNAGRDKRAKKIIKAVEKAFRPYEVGKPGAPRGTRNPVDLGVHAPILLEAANVHRRLAAIFATRRDDEETFQEQLEDYCVSYAKLTRKEAETLVVNFLRRKREQHKPTFFTNILVSRGWAAHRPRGTTQDTLRS